MTKTGQLSLTLLMLFGWGFGGFILQLLQLGLREFFNKGDRYTRYTRLQSLIDWVKVQPS
ncbi:hypothetical protein I8748_10355 [Nostoc sp. CENA67]|uniref:Uncharacterized protein n=1 Tax=Amazonocrinis nigriterrae CENA67 TaxID=2794033 RepID=A0A8J7HU99_9NOST|nr:hypothetical protein [Amazonocrinis nigriterrae]MBH8562574.1 hypothetical protein [Amazonocrinis nigriterrae CENA67]